MNIIKGCALPECSAAKAQSFIREIRGQAARARSRGEVTWEAMIEAEARVRALDVKLRRVFA